MPKLSTWLVVALTGAAFLVGILSATLLAGGSGGHPSKEQARHTPQSTAVRTVTTPAPSAPTTVYRSASVRRARELTLPRAPGARGAAPAASRTVSGDLHTTTGGGVAAPGPAAPEPNLMADSPPAPSSTPAPPAAPSQPAAAPVAPAQPSPPAESEAGARAEMATAAVNLLQSDTAESGAGEAARMVVAELEHCLELVATSGLPPGIEPSGCGSTE